MADVIYVPSAAGSFEVGRSHTGIVARDLLRRGEKLRLLAVKQVGKDTGRLAASIRTQLKSDSLGLFVDVGSDNHIALFHHNGTRPHMIYGRRGGAMRFTSRGRIMYARVVHHPGTKPNRFLTNNLRKVVR